VEIFGSFADLLPVLENNADTFKHIGITMSKI
jgi:hypothetical protein